MKKIKTLFLASLFSGLVLSTTGCTLNSDWRKSNTTWYSGTAKMTIVNHSFGYVYLDEERVEFSIAWKNTLKEMCFYRMPTCEQEGISDNDLYLSGAVIHKNKQITYEIKEDKLLGRKFRKIIFEEREMTEEESSFYQQTLDKLTICGEDSSENKTRGKK